MREILPNIYQWSWFSEERKLDFNGHLLILGKERVIIDPPPLSEEAQKKISDEGWISYILLTNRDHTRQSERYRELFKTKVLIHEQDAPLIEFQADETFKDGELLPGGLKVVHIPHGKSPGESALYLNQGKGVMLLGDALIGNPPGAFKLLPPEKYADINKAKEGIKVLLAYDYDAVLVGDGTSILTEGKRAIERFLKV